MKEVLARCVVLALVTLLVVAPICLAAAATPGTPTPEPGPTTPSEPLTPEQQQEMLRMQIKNDIGIDLPSSATVTKQDDGKYLIKDASGVKAGGASVNSPFLLDPADKSVVTLNEGGTADLASGCSVKAGADGATISNGAASGDYMYISGPCAGGSTPGQTPQPDPADPPPAPDTGAPGTPGTPPAFPPEPLPDPPWEPSPSPTPSTTPGTEQPSDNPVEWPGTGTGVDDLEPGSDGVTVGDADSFDLGPTQVFDGHHLSIGKDFICGESAGSIFIRGDITTNAEGFCVHKKQVDVRHAETMMVRCATGGSVWSTQNVTDVTLTVDQSIGLRSDAPQTLEVTDCAGREINVTLMGKGSQAKFERDGIEMAVHNAQTEFEGDEFTVKEVANATGWGHIVFDKQSGKVQFVVMDPDFSYRFLTKEPWTDFAFHATGGPHTLWIRRTADDSIPQDVRGCITCSIVDIPSRTITLKADVAYERRWVDAQGNAVEDRYATVVRSTSPDNLVEMRMDKEFAIIEDLFVRRDAPPLFVAFSNHLNVTEMGIEGTRTGSETTGADAETDAAPGSSTHRLLGINDKAEPAQLSRTLVRSYRTAYSSATMTMDDAQAIYQRGSLVIKAYPAGSDKAKALVAGLLGVNAMLALAAFMLLPRRFFEKSATPRTGKRAQLTLFILLGLLMLFLIILLLMSVSGSKQLRPADEAGVNGFLKDCGSQRARDTLVYVGSQGGTSRAPFARWFDQRMTPVPISEIEYVMSRDLEERLPSCLQAMRGIFNNIQSVKTTAAEVETTITRDTVSFKAHFPLVVTLKDGTSFTVTDKMLVENNRLSQTINLALAMILSEQTHDGLIDLDTLQADQATMTLFPHEKQLLTYIKDENYIVPYEFAMANRR